MPGCPLCEAPLADEQSWCLECGAAARTRIAPTPRRWPLMLLAIGLGLVLALAGITAAFVHLLS